MYARALTFALICWLLSGPVPAWAQSGGSYDASWYTSDAPYVQIDVTADGVYRVSGSALRDALPDGTALADIPPATIRLIDKGAEIPIHLSGTADGTLDGSDTITFVGHRNRGRDERWAYNYDRSAQSSTYFSLYADTTTYWMTWGGETGRRYDTNPGSASASPTSALRDTVHAEQDNLYYFGRPNANGDPLYTFSEGYFWRRFSHGSTSPISFTHTLSVGRRTETSTALDLTVRLDAATNSCHRVAVEGELRQSDGSVAFEPLRTVEWEGTARETITASVPQQDVPADGLTLRLTSYNDNFPDEINGRDCPDPSNTPNDVLLDWIEAAYTRSLEATNNTQRFVAPRATDYSFVLSGYSSSTLHVYNPGDARRFEVPVTNGTATISDAPTAPTTPYWAVGDEAYRRPAAIRPDTPSNWGDPSANGADYLILTTKALLPSARKLADYRRAHDGYEVDVALVQNVFDEFDYGRPTPIAIRRLVRASQAWSPAPRFLTIFGDAQYPIRDGSVSSLYPEWSVPSFGYSPSDGWFAMQTDGTGDWSEVLAVGRIPVRSVAQGDLFVEKLRTYESAPLTRWQKNMLLLAGGTSEGEQASLQRYSNWWGEIAADTFATTRSYSGPVHTGMDTSRYYKNVNATLDASFQESLAVDLRQGTGWLNYFGHSSAQTWEIVTDPPSEFDNAGRLPIVSSIGCRTGSFAGGRFEEKSAPSLGEQLVVGAVRPDGTPRGGARNGAIAHFGESALGFLIPSARLNDALVRSVFVDTTRVLGEAIRAAKAEINADFDNNDLYAKHLRQYGLLGDPATNIAIPTRPDLHVASNLISTTPTAPTLSDDLTVSVTVQNRGMIPRDSVGLRLTWRRPDGSTVQRTRRLQRFPLERTVSFSFPLDERALGSNTFRVDVDPQNEYTEVTETDNQAERTQVVFDTGVSLISPGNFGTVSSARPPLTFSVARQTADPIPVVLQLDSVPDFSSPFLQETRQEVTALQNTWRPPPLDANTTYYWRARTANSDAWKSSRFTVTSSLPENSWLQRGRLFSANTNASLQRSGQDWRFAQFDRNVSTMSERGQGSRPDGFVVDGTSDYEYLRFGFGVLVVNDLTGEVRASKSFPTYDLREESESFSEVGEQQEAIDSLAAFLGRVPERGDYVFVRTRHLARQSSATIPDTVKSLLRNLGPSATTSTPHSAAIDTLTYRHVWAMKARKGDPDATVERVSPPSEAGEVFEIILDTRVSFPRPSGTTLTPLIGPVSDWSTLSWNGTAADEGDALRMQVLARDSTVLIDALSGASGEQSLDQIDAAAHPYLRLRATLSDSTTRTAPQLAQWSVTYDGVPELAADPAGLRSVPDTVQQGKDVSLSFPIANLGSVPSGPIRVQYDVTDAANATRTFATDTLDALPPGARDTTSARLSTTDLPGLNVLTVTAASDGPPERITNNNTIIRSVFVRRDQAPPSLKVLANGRSLPPTPTQVNDLQAPSLPFVSTQPSFEISLRDDNPYLALSDTSHLQVYLKGGLPSTNPRPVSDFQRIPFASNQLTLVSADSSGSNALRARFEPTLRAQDSTYTMKVEATDAKNNAIEPYQTSFRVQQRQVIQDVYPYPNPMSAHTTFAFRVKGGRDEMLRDFSLRLYTLSGRLIRELDRTDLQAPLSVGWNTVRWNGRDADGDRVATGIYLYRVRIEGSDQTFRGDVEKVTVIR
jgi:hypothetical protein